MNNKVTSVNDPDINIRSSSLQGWLKIEQSLFPQLKNLKAYLYLPISALTGATAFGIGNRIKQQQENIDPGTSETLKERKYELLKGAIHGAAFSFLPGFLNKENSFTGSLVFLLKLAYAYTPFYNTVDSAALKYFDIDNNKHTPYLKLFTRQTYKALQFTYSILPPFEGRNIKEKILKAVLLRGGLINVLAFWLAPDFLLPTVATSIGVLFSYYHATDRNY
jgi:hypothetical protein